MEVININNIIQTKSVNFYFLYNTSCSCGETMSLVHHSALVQPIYTHTVNGNKNETFYSCIASRYVSHFK